MDININDEELEKMIEGILNPNSENVLSQNEYVDEKAEAFLSELKGMVK